MHILNLPMHTLQWTRKPRWLAKPRGSTNGLWLIGKIGRASREATHVRTRKIVPKRGCGRSIAVAHNIYRFRPYKLRGASRKLSQGQKKPVDFVRHSCSSAVQFSGFRPLGMTHVHVSTCPQKPDRSLPPFPSTLPHNNAFAIRNRKTSRSRRRAAGMRTHVLRL